MVYICDSDTSAGQPKVPLGVASHCLTEYSTVIDCLLTTITEYVFRMKIKLIIFSSNNLNFSGLGLALTMQPTSVVLTYYFDRLLARANGISFAGVGVGVFVLSPLFQFLIDTYGWQGALLVIAAIAGHSGICAALYRPTPLEIESQKVEKTDRNMTLSQDGGSTSNKCSGARVILANILASFDCKLLKSINFACLLAAEFLYGISIAVILLYTAARAEHAGISHFHSAMLLSIMGICSFLSRITHGYIIDYKLMTATVLTATAYGVGAISLSVNPLVHTYEGLAVLSALVGLSSGVFNSTGPIVAKEYVGLQKLSGAVGWIHLGVGTGVILGSYIAGKPI